MSKTAAKKRKRSDVLEDVVSGFVAKNKKCFVRGHLPEPLSVNDHAF